MYRKTIINDVNRKLSDTLRTLDPAMVSIELNFNLECKGECDIL